MGFIFKMLVSYLVLTGQRKYNFEHWTWSLTSIEFYVTLFVDSLDVNIASVINTKKEFLVPNIHENVVFLVE